LVQTFHAGSGSGFESGSGKSEKSDTDHQKIISDLQPGEEFGFAEFFLKGYGGLNSKHVHMLTVVCMYSLQKIDLKIKIHYKT
jgi:hypothetical protein